MEWIDHKMCKCGKGFDCSSDSPWDLGCPDCETKKENKLKALEDPRKANFIKKFVDKAKEDQFEIIELLAEEIYDLKKRMDTGEEHFYPDDGMF